MDRPDYEQSFNEDLDALKASVPGNEDVVRAITVGSECLYRDSLSAPALLSRIQQVQKAFPKVQVGTVDSWNKFNDGSADPIIQGGVTYLLANGFAYWQSQNIDNATNTYFDDMSQAMHHIQSVAGDNKDKIRFGNGETGWPTGMSSLSLSYVFPCIMAKLTSNKTVARTTALRWLARPTLSVTGKSLSAVSWPGVSTSSTSRPLTSRGSPRARATMAR